MPTLDYQHKDGHGEAFYIEGKCVWVRDGNTLPAICLSCGCTDHLESIHRQLQNSEKSFTYFLCRDCAEYQQTGIKISLLLGVTGGALMLSAFLFATRNFMLGAFLQMLGLSIIIVNILLLQPNVSPFYLRGLRNDYIGLRGIKAKVRGALKAR